MNLFEFDFCHLLWIHYYYSFNQTCNFKIVHYYSHVFNAKTIQRKMKVPISALVIIDTSSELLLFVSNHSGGINSLIFDMKSLNVKIPIKEKIKVPTKKTATSSAQSTLTNMYFGWFCTENEVEKKIYWEFETIKINFIELFFEIFTSIKKNQSEYQNLREKIDYNQLAKS